MPLSSERRKEYGPGWTKLSKRIRFVRAGNKCEFCGAENYKPHPITGSRVVLTVAHLDHDHRNHAEENLKALCQRCHNRYDAAHRQVSRKRRLVAHQEQRR